MKRGIGYHFYTGLKTEAKSLVSLSDFDQFIERGDVDGVMYAIDRIIDLEREKSLKIGMAKGLENSMKTGMAKGLEKGREIGMKILIDNMLRKGRSVEDVARETDLPVSRVIFLRDYREPTADE